jgi:hypothetical protein
VSVSSDVDAVMVIALLARRIVFDSMYLTR